MPPVRSQLLLWIFEGWNNWALQRAKAYASREALYLNKAMYGSQMFSSILVYSSQEKRNINRGMPKGKKMNHAQVLNWSLFIVTPEQARKTEKERKAARWWKPRKKIM